MKCVIEHKRFYCTVSFSVLYLQEGGQRGHCGPVEFDTLHVISFSAEVHTDDLLLSVVLRQTGVCCRQEENKNYKQTK